MKRRTPFPALARLVAMGAAVAVVGCQDDPLSGPARVVGDVLLDFAVTPAATTLPPSGSVAISGGNRDTLTVTLANLPALPAGMSYQVLLAADSAARAGADSTLNHLRPVNGRIIRVVRSSRPVNRDSVAVTSATDTTLSAPLVITAADTNQSFVMRIIGVPQGDSVRKYTHVVVTATASPRTSGERIDPTKRTGFMYARFRDTKGTVSTADDAFGGSNFIVGSFAVNPSWLFNFNASASVNAAIRGRELRINLRGLTRPPEGFRYASWLIDARTGTHVRVGELRTPEPGSVSLNDADIGSGGLLTRDGIIAAEVRAHADSLGIEFDDFTRYALVLEVKGAPPARAPGWEVLVGPIPQSVASRHPSPGTLTGTVTSTSGGTVTGTTLYLTGVGLTAPLLVTNANATGDFRFRSVNVGSYELHAIPPGRTTVAATLPVTIGTVGTGTTAKGDSVHVTVTIP